MSYVRRRSRAAALARPVRHGMSGLLSDLWDGITQGIDPTAAAQQAAACTAATPDTSSLLAMASKIADVGTNWNPSGVFTPDDIQRIVAETTAMLNPPWSQIQAEMATFINSDMRTALSKFQDIGQQGLNYTVAAQQARATGQYVSAPGIKQWVLDAMNATMNGMIAAAEGVCDQPTWLSNLGAFQSAFDTVWSDVKAVAGEAVSLAKSAVHAAEGAFDLVATVEEIAPYAAVGLLAWWLFLRERRRR